MELTIPQIAHDLAIACLNHETIADNITGPRKIGEEIEEQGKRVAEFYKGIYEAINEVFKPKTEK